MLDDSHLQTLKFRNEIIIITIQFDNPTSIYKLGWVRNLIPIDNPTNLKI